MKLAGIGFRFFWLKNETGWWFHDFMGHKIMKPTGSVKKKLQKSDFDSCFEISFFFRQFHVKLDETGWFFFSTEPIGFIILCPIKSWNHQPVSFLTQKKSETNTSQFHSSFTWNWSKIKNKNKDGFYWNLIFYIKQGNKSRVGTFFQNALVLLNWTKPTYSCFNISTTQRF